jgi:hypothetical protein
MAERPTPASVFARLRLHRPTIFYGVPTLYAAQLQALEAKRPDLSSLRPVYRLTTDERKTIVYELVPRPRPFPGKIPLPMRFFGGNNEEFFIPGESWQIRANPVIRAIPGSRLFRTADGAGHVDVVVPRAMGHYGMDAKLDSFRLPMALHRLLASSLEPLCGLCAIAGRVRRIAVCRHRTA